MIAGKKAKGFTPIGVDVRDSSVHAVQFDCADGRYTLHAAASCQLGPDEQGPGRASGIIAALRSLRRTHPFAGSGVVSAVPRGEADVRPITLPAGVESDDSPRFHDALMTEARSCLLYDPKDAVIDYLPLGVDPASGGTCHTLLLIGAKRENVNRHISLFQAAGLDCLHLDLAACAATRMIADDGDVSAVIDVDASHTSVSVARGADVIFSRTLGLGLHHVVGELARALDVSFHDASVMLRVFGVGYHADAGIDVSGAAQTGLVDLACVPGRLREACGEVLERFAAEVRRSVEYFSNQRRGVNVRKAWLLGDSLPMDLDALLAKRLSMSVTIPNGFGINVPEIDCFSHEHGVFAVAAGLAMRGCMR